MEGYIDEYGRLWIKRKKEFIQCQCRTTDNKGMPFCDHRCSRFGDPMSSEKIVWLGLCTKTLKFTKFRDLRGK